MIKRENLLQSQEIDIICRVDGGSHSVDGVGHWNPPSQDGAVLNVIHPSVHKTIWLLRQSLIISFYYFSQQTGIVQHLDHIVDDVELLGRNVQPVVESQGEFDSYLLTLALK